MVVEGGRAVAVGRLRQKEAEVEGEVVRAATLVHQVHPLVVVLVVGGLVAVELARWSAMEVDLSVEVEDDHHHRRAQS